jgi:hypothetical protein
MVDALRTGWEHPLLKELESAVTKLERAAR